MARTATDTRRRVLGGLLAAALLALGGCGSDIAELRSQQVALQQRIEDLESKLASFRETYDRHGVVVPFVGIAAEPEAFARTYKPGETLEGQLANIVALAANQMKLDQLDWELAMLKSGSKPPAKPASEIDWNKLARTQIEAAIEQTRALREAQASLRDVERRIAAEGEKP